MDIGKAIKTLITEVANLLEAGGFCAARETVAALKFQGAQAGASRNIFWGEVWAGAALPATVLPCFTCR